MPNRNGIKKPDVFSNPYGIGDEIEEATYHALGPLSRIVRDATRKWGLDRLPTLVAPETAAKFGSAKAKLDRAVDSRDVAEINKRVAVMIRAWTALDTEATKGGHEPIKGEAWMWQDGDQLVGVASDTAAADHLRRVYAKRSGDQIEIYSLAELVGLVNLTRKTQPTIGKIKTEFTGTVARVSVDTWDEEVGDDIPF